MKARAKAGRWAVLVGAIACALALTAAPASAATVPATCSTFGSTLASATNGETIVLTGMCTGTQASYTLPSVTGLTIEGATGTTSGFDGTGASGPALFGTGIGLTLRNLTFQNYTLSSESAVTLQPTGGALPVIDSDRFLGNTLTDSFGIAGGLRVIDDSPGTCPYTGPLTITNSTFSGNSSTATTPSGLALGGGASFLFSCISPATASIVITGNTLTNNTINAPSGDIADGAGLYAGNGENGQLTARQSGNVFRNNSIRSTVATPSGQYSGAGEWLGSFNLISVGDVFVGNALPGPSGASAASEGAGLAAVRGNCGTTGNVSATATNLVASGNTIGAPSSGGSVEGAGVYAGCAASTGSGGFHLTLVNSTVTNNSGPGGSAGVDGESTDQLTLENSIVHGDTGAGSTELGGFGIGGGTGSISAAGSDVCAVGSTTAPFAGTGNICADPKLANVSAADVHETSSSPTIDAGSNALVPTGVTTDVYGRPRIVGTKQSTAIVDIGAAEDQTAFSPIGTDAITNEKATSNGVTLTVTCQGAANQSCNGNVTVTSTETLTNGKVTAVASRKHHKRKVVVARAHYKLAGGKSITLKIKLNRKGRKLLKRFGKLPVKVTVTEANSAGKQVTISSHKLKIKRRKKHK